MDKGSVCPQMPEIKKETLRAIVREPESLLFPLNRRLSYETTCNKGTIVLGITCTLGKITSLFKEQWIFEMD